MVLNCFCRSLFHFCLQTLGKTQGRPKSYKELDTKKVVDPSEGGHEMNEVVAVVVNLPASRTDQRWSTIIQLVQ